MTTRVVYNGAEMVEGWPERIQEAQKVLEYSIAIGCDCEVRGRFGCDTLLLAYGLSAAPLFTVAFYVLSGIARLIIHLARRFSP